MLSRISSAIAKTDILTRGKLVEEPGKRRGIAFIHGVNGMLQGVNAVVAGTPAAYATAPLAMAFGVIQWGIGGVFTFFSSGTSPGAKDEGKGMRRDGTIAFLAGAAAAIPVYGNYVNATAAAYNATHAVNNAVA